MVTLEQAKGFIEQGDCTRARRVLAYILRENRDNVEAWVLLSQCVLNQYEYDRCRKEVLRRVPDHPAFQLPQNIPDPADPVTESLAALGLMTQQMPAYTTKQVQAIGRKPRRRENPAYLNRFRVRVLRWVMFTGIGVMLLIALVLLGVYLGDLAAERDVQATQTQSAYNNAAATIYLENTFTAATVQVRATQVSATAQASITPQITTIDFARLVLRQANGLERRSTFTTTEAVSVEFGLASGVSTSEQLVVQIVDTNGNIIAQQTQTIGSVRIVTVMPPASGWAIGNYTLEILIHGVTASVLPFDVVA